MQRTDSLEKTLMLGKIEGRRRGQQRMRWSAGTLENSILNAYLHTIRESRHFLYIEVCRSEGGAEKLRISCQWAQSFRAGIAGPGELGEAWTQGREPGDGDGDMELRAGTADGGPDC